MIVDAHVYLVHEKARRRTFVLPKEEIAIKKAFYNHPDIDKIFPLASVESLLKSMEESEIGKTIVMGLAWNTHEICEENNEYVYKCLQKYSDKLIGFVSIQPRAGKRAVLMAEKYIKKYGFRGIKVTPNFQHYHVNDKIVFPVIELAIDLDIPVMIHSDHLFQKPNRDHPYYVIDLVRRYPEAKIIMSHLGSMLFMYHYYEPMKHLLQNIYFDTAVSASMGMVKIAAEIKPDHIIFGTDFPFNHCHSQKEVLDSLRNLNLDREVKSKIIGENINKLLYAKQ